MKLWIRSQNKESLAIIKSLCYANHGGKNVVMGGEETTFDIVLGKYHTKERCLEIIDEIQKLLEMGNPQNAFMIFNDYDYLSRDEVDEILKQVRTDKAVFTSREGFSVVMPSVITYEMPEK